MKVMKALGAAALTASLAVGGTLGFTSPADATPTTAPTPSTSAASTSSSHDDNVTPPKSNDSQVNKDTTCNTTTDANGNTVQDCSVVGEDEFHVNEHFTNQESLTLNQHGVTWLTIQVHPMTPQQVVGQCKTLPIGTWIWNGFVNPTTGVVKYKHWQVTSGPGENKFCIGADHQWHKFNCNNPVRGPQFGTPPPPPSQRLKARVKTGDYATWNAHKKLTANKHIGGSIDVQSQDGRCKAHAELDNKVQIRDWMSVTFRSRNLVQAKLDAVKAVKVKAGSSQSLHGKLTQKARIFIDAKISAQCTTPPTNEAPAPEVTLDTLNQVIETKSATTGLGVQVYGGDTVTVTISTLYGQITTPKTFTNVKDSWNTSIGYTAPGEIPDGTQSFNDPDVPKPPAGYDQVLVVVVDNQTGKKVKKFTNVKITPLNPAPRHK